VIQLVAEILFNDRKTAIGDGKRLNQVSVVIPLRLSAVQIVPVKLRQTKES
jgi:hypothetical protein